MTAAHLLTLADFAVTGTAVKDATAGTITVRGNGSGQAVATDVQLGTTRFVIRLDSHTGASGAVVRFGDSATAPTQFIDIYRSSQWGWYFGQKNPVDQGPTSTQHSLGPLPVYLGFSITNGIPKWETSADLVTWETRRTGFAMTNPGALSVLIVEARDGALENLNVFSGINAANAAPPPPPPATGSARTVTWNPKSGSTITRPENTFYRAIAAAAGNLEAETSQIAVTTGTWDVTFSAKTGAGAARAGDLYGNLFRADNSYHSTAFLGPAAQYGAAFASFTGRVTIPDTVTKLTLAPAYYNAVLGDAVDLQPSVSLVAATSTPPTAGGGTSGSLLLAGNPLVPLQRYVASTSVVQPTGPAPSGTLKQGNFQSHVAQPYSAHTSMWGANLAGNEQMTSTSSLRIFPEFPARTEFEWNITADPRRPDDVNGYLHVDYGNYDWSPSRLPDDAVRQVKDITALDLATTWTLTNTSGSAPGLLAELWLSPQAAAQGQFPKSHEIAFFPRLSAAVAAYVQTLVPVGPGSFTDSFGVLWNVVEGGSFTGEPYLIAYRPGNVDFEGRLPFRDLLAFLRTHHKVSGNEWVNGLAFGVEPRNGAGKLSIDTYSPTYTYGPVTADVVAFNRLANGDFGQGDAGWSGFYFSGKSISAGKAVFANSPAFDGIARPVPVVAGKFYDVSMRITGYGGGDVRVQFSGGTVRDGTARAANGVFTQRLQANTGNTTYNLLPGGSGFTGSVQNLTVVGPYDTA